MIHRNNNKKNDISTTTTTIFHVFKSIRRHMSCPKKTFVGIVHVQKKAFAGIFHVQNNLFIMCIRVTLLRMSKANEVPITSHVWVASTIFKQLQNH